jgi:hypothetical protein
MQAHRIGNETSFKPGQETISLVSERDEAIGPE